MKIVKKNQTYFINFKTNIESEELDNYTNKELDLKIINDKTVIFSVRDDTPAEKTPIVGQQLIQKSPSIKKEETKIKIKSILCDKDLSFKDKVEGNFEDLLKKEDLEIFKEMLKEKEIITFKQSDKYKKAIYVVNEDFKKPNIENKPKEVSSQKVIDENSDLIIKDFLKKKYAIIKTPIAADKFSKEFYMKFKNNEIKGQKSFDSYFYVIDLNVYEKTRELILKCNLQKSFTLEELSTKINKEEELLKVTIEFLKEEGLIIEKKKNIYCLI